MSARAQRAVGPWLFDAVFDAVPDAMLVADDTGRYIAANPAALELLARSRDEILSSTVAEVSPPGVDVEAAWQDFLRRGRASGEYVLVRPDGSQVEVHFEAYANVRPGYHLSILREISRLKRLERDLAGERRRAESILDSISDAFIALDGDWRITYANRAAQRMMGRDREEMIGRLLWDEFPETRGSAFEHNYRRAVAERTSVSFEAYYPEPLGIWFEVRAHPLREGGLAIYATDITEQRGMREELESARRLESLAVLSAGVSHEFNTVMAMIRGHAELLRQDLGVDEEPAIAAIDAALDHALWLTRRMLSFARQQPVDRRVIHINEVVSSLLPLIEPLLAPKIELQVELTEEDVRVEVDSLLEQCVLDLVANAREAMRDGGCLTIATGVQPRAVGDADPDRSIPRAFLQVADTGSGMDEDTRERAVEPFFTTKPAGRGAGMGLSSAYGIVAQIGGTLTIDSTPGEGTTVTVFVPTAT
jgi:PAS domain S-box-containing protein